MPTRCARCAAARREAALLIALADIGGVWPVERVTRALTEFADAALGAAVRYLLRGAAAQASSSRAIRGKPEQGSGYVVLAMGKMGAFELNYSSDIDLIVLYDADASALAEGVEPGALVRPPHAQSGQADAGAHRRRLRVPHRSAPASRSRLDADRDLARLGAELLREHRAELGARRDDQGAPLRGRSRGRRGVPQGGRAVRLAQISRLRRGRRRARDEAPDGRLQGPRRDRDRGPQHQARARRHPRDRVLRADAAADRRRAASRAARAADAGDAGRPRQGRLDRPRRRARSRRGLSLPARGRAPPADGGRRADPHAAGRARRRSSASRAFSASPDRDAFAAVLLEHLRKVQRHYARLFEDAPAAEASRRALAFPARQGRHRDARQARRDGLSPSARSQPRGAALARGRIPLAQERVRARASRRAGAGADRPSGALGKSRSARWSRSTASSPACMAARGCCRCCGAIRISSRCSRSCSATRRGSPIFWRCIRR